MTATCLPFLHVFLFASVRVRVSSRHEPCSQGSDVACVSPRTNIYISISLYIFINIYLCLPPSRGWVQRPLCSSLLVDPRRSVEVWKYRSVACHGQSVSHAMPFHVQYRYACTVCVIPVCGSFGSAFSCQPMVYLIPGINFNMLLL